MDTTADGGHSKVLTMAEDYIKNTRSVKISRATHGEGRRHGTGAIDNAAWRSQTCPQRQPPQCQRRLNLDPGSPVDK